MENITPFLPSSFDMSPYLQWAPATARLGALVLGLMVFLGIVTEIAAGAVYAFSVLTSSAARMKTAKNMAKGGVALILLGIFFGVIITVITTFVSYVKG